MLEISTPLIEGGQQSYSPFPRGFVLVRSVCHDLMTTSARSCSHATHRHRAQRTVPRTTGRIRIGTSWLQSRYSARSAASVRWRPSVPSKPNHKATGLSVGLLGLIRLPRQVHCSLDGNNIGPGVPVRRLLAHACCQLRRVLDGGGLLVRQATCAHASVLPCICNSTRAHAEKCTGGRLRSCADRANAGDAQAGVPWQVRKCKHAGGRACTSMHVAACEPVREIASK